MKTINDLHGDYTYELRRAYMQGYMLAKHGQAIAEWRAKEGNNGVAFYSSSSGMEINGCTHAQVVELIKLLAIGDWEKEPYYDANFSYSCSVIGQLDYTITIIGGPPAACKIVEVEEEVPASKRIVRKVVCPEPTTASAS